MSMDEIRDLTLAAFSHHQRIDQTFRIHLESLEQLKSGTTTPLARFQQKIVLVPLRTIQLSDLPRKKHLQARLPDRPIAYVWEDERRRNLVLSTFEDYYAWRPILRGIQSIEVGDRSGHMRKIQADGSIAFAAIHNYHDESRLLLYPEWMMGLVANALWTSHKVQNELQYPELSFGLHYECEVEHRDLRFMTGPNLLDDSFPLRPQRIVLPRMEVQGREDFDNILTSIDRDLWHSAGFDMRRKIVVEWPV